MIELHQKKLCGAYNKMLEAKELLCEIHTARTDWYGHIIDPLLQAKSACAAAIGDLVMQEEREKSKAAAAAKGGVA